MYLVLNFFRNLKFVIAWIADRFLVRSEVASRRLQFSDWPATKNRSRAPRTQNPQLRSQSRAPQNRALKILSGAFSLALFCSHSLNFRFPLFLVLRTFYCYIFFWNYLYFLQWHYFNNIRQVKKIWGICVGAQINWKGYENLNIRCCEVINIIYNFFLYLGIN